MQNKKTLMLLGVLVLLVTVVSLSYAFFQAQGGDTVTRDVQVLTHTVDTLTFSIDDDIEIEATQQNFARNGVNQSDEANVTAILTPNSKTGTATKNYYLYLHITSNPIGYSAANTNEDAELLLQVFDSSDNLVTLTGLGSQVTVGSLTGYDITGVRGLKTLLNNHTITASNSATTTEEWRVVVTLINHNFNQNDNTGKTLEAELIIREDELDLGLTGTIYRNNTRTAFNNHTIEDEISNVWCREDNGVPDCTWPFAAQQICEYGGDTCSQGTATLGVGSYETNVNTIRTATYNVYCPIGQDNPTCGYNWYYETEQDCIDDVDTSTYTCTAGTITRPYYLKHVVEENIIESTEACLWYNNAEFCLGLNYWVETGNGNAQHESTENGVATKNKLQTAMEAALGTTADSCNSNSYYAICNFGDFNCYADANGYVYCYGGDGSCGVYGDGTSVCGW